MHLLATKPMAKWSKANNQSLGGLWVKIGLKFFLSNFSILLNFSAIFVHVPFCDFNTIIFINVEVFGPLRSLSIGMIPTVLF